MANIAAVGTMTIELCASLFQRKGEDFLTLNEDRVLKRA